MQYFLPEYIKLQSELVQRSTFFWLVYLQTSRHATQMNWINTKVKCIVHMGLSKVKYCANLLFHSDQSECYIQASKKDSLFLFFASLNLSTCLFIQLELMVQCYNSKTEEKKIQDFLDFNQKMGKTVAAKLVLTFLPYRLWTCHLSREK